MNIQEQIINDLKDVANSSGEVDFMNVYKGLPIVNKAYIQAIHNNVVTFTIHKQQAACLKHDNSPLILSNSLRDAASGDVTALDTSSHYQIRILNTPDTAYADEWCCAWCQTIRSK